MTMTAVESSNILAIGFEDGLMRVPFKNGNEYEYPGVTAEQHAAVMAAPSKGRAMNILVAQRAGLFGNLNRAPVDWVKCAAGTMTHIHQAENCCATYLNKASMAGALDTLAPFSCLKCGTEYRATAHGPLMLWEAQVDVLVFKP